MQDSSVQEKKVILIILGLLIFSVFLAGIKRYYPKAANSILYVQSNEISAKKTFPNNNASSSLGLIKINTATSADLIELSGIGQVIAARIIDYRNAQGLFRTKEDLLNIKGIGMKKLEKIQDKISLE